MTRQSAGCGGDEPHARRARRAAGCRMVGDSDESLMDAPSLIRRYVLPPTSRVVLLSAALRLDPPIPPQRPTGGPLSAEVAAVRRPRRANAAFWNRAGARRALGHRRNPGTVLGKRGCDMSDTITIAGTSATDPEQKQRRTVCRSRPSASRARSAASTGRPGRGSTRGTNWYTVSAYRGLAEHAFESLHKGDRVILTGRLQRAQLGHRREARARPSRSTPMRSATTCCWGTTRFTRDSPAAASSTQPVATSGHPPEAGAAPATRRGRRVARMAPTRTASRRNGPRQRSAKQPLRPLDSPACETPF